MKLVYNLSTELWPKVSHLHDYVLLRPGNYKHRGFYDVPAFLETEFRGKINLYEQARKQLDVARDGDILIAPDVLNDYEGTVDRIEDWLKFIHDRDMDGKDLQILLAPQGENPMQVEWCLAHYLAFYDSDYIGIGIFTIKNALVHGRNRLALKLGQAVKAAGRKLHLLGWSVIMRSDLVPIELYRIADTVDSQSVFGYLTQRRITMDENMKWVPHPGDLEERYILALENGVAYWDRIFKRRSLRDG